MNRIRAFIRIDSLNTNRCTVALATLAIGFVADGLRCVADDLAEKPICRIAAISSPYITTLSAKELGERSWIEKIAPAGLKQSLAAVKALEPDAFVVLGSLTWTGSDSDFVKLKRSLADVSVPVYTVPGPKDVADGGMSRYLQHFAKQDMLRKSISVKGVHLQFAMHPETRTAKSEGKLLDWMQADFESAKNARGILLFGGLHYQSPREGLSPHPLQERYWKLLRKVRPAVRLVGGHSHTVMADDGLPIWSVPSSGWSYSPKWSVALISVFAKRVELRLIREAGQPPQTLVVPNPVAAKPTIAAKDDPYGVPTYSEDLARKPELTFIQLSDSQFDDKTVPRYASRYHYDVPMNKLAALQVNRLNPALVFMTGDLTNKNTEAEWKTFNSIYSKLKPPFYAMPGNHDTLYDRAKMDPKTFGDLYQSGVKNWKLADKLAGKTETDRTALYRHFVGREPYYSVEKQGCVFICLNTGVASVDKEQMKWLRKELERTKSAKHVFVLGHYPVLAAFGGNVQGPEAAEILVLLRQYKVAAYLSGHRHRYGYRVHDGTAHVLCDCLCWGEYRSFQIYHVFPDRVIACWKPIFRADGNRPLYERVVLPEPRYRPAD